MVAFDNDQVVGKSWRVSTDNKVKSFLPSLLPFVQLPLILGPAIFQMNSLRLLIIHKTGSTTHTGFVQKLDNIRNQDGTYFDEVYDTHYQMLCHNLD